MVKALIFDWHGVLDETNYEGVINKLANFKKTTPKNVKSLINKSLERDYVCGLISPKKYWESVKTIFSLSGKEILEVKNYILEIVYNKLLWEKLPSLHSSYITAILSDCPKDKTDEIRKINLKDFDYIHFSSDKGLSKENRDFFLNLISEINIRPEECLYIDDSKKHIETAKNLGFKTCLFNSIEDLNKLLK